MPKVAAKTETPYSPKGRGVEPPAAGGQDGNERPVAPTTDPPSAEDRRWGWRDPYLPVVATLLLLAVATAIALLVLGTRLGNAAFLDVALTFVVTAGLMVGTLTALLLRAGVLPAHEAQPTETLENSARATETTTATDAAEPTTAPEESASPDAASATFSGEVLGIEPSFLRPVSAITRRLQSASEGIGALGRIRASTAIVGAVGLVTIFQAVLFSTSPTPRLRIVAVVICVVAAVLQMTAARYLSGDDSHFPEARELSQVSRVDAWLLLLTAISVGLDMVAPVTAISTLHFLLFALNVVIVIGLFRRVKHEDARFYVDLGAFSVLGERANVVASLLDAAERRFGIDVRSTWALAFVRQSLEPLALALVLAGWLSTSLTVIGVEEQGIVEHFGVPSAGPPELSGLHVHWPWPIDHVYRFPVRRVQTIGIGHEGEEAPGPENVIWSVKHAENEFTLLLGNGRDLITVDAAVHYRIIDPRAWRYHSQNPADALRALAYRAVMRNTVNRTLTETLSENVALLSEQMRRMVQHDADAMGLGVNVVAFTVGGMHPPVPVAQAYEAVVSAQIARHTAVVNAQAYRNSLIPASSSAALASANAARAEGLDALGRAAGDAWAFRTLEAQFRSSPSDYYFRRRLEELEKALSGKQFTIVDNRFIRDGGELWLTP